MENSINDKEKYPGNLNSLAIWDSLNKKDFSNGAEILSRRDPNFKRPTNYIEIQNQNPNFNYIWGDESFVELYEKLNNLPTSNDKLVFSLLIITSQFALNDKLVARKCIEKLIDHDKEVYKSIPKTMLEQIDLKPLNKWKLW
jgi:hypothetical protein